MQCRKVNCRRSASRVRRTAELVSHAPDSATADGAAETAGAAENAAASETAGAAETAAVSETAAAPETVGAESTGIAGAAKGVVVARSAAAKSAAVVKRSETFFDIAFRQTPSSAAGISGINCLGGCGRSFSICRNSPLTDFARNGRRPHNMRYNTTPKL